MKKGTNAEARRPGWPSAIITFKGPLVGFAQAGVLASCLFLVGCGGASPSPTPVPSPQPMLTSTPIPTATLSIAPPATSTSSPGPTATSEPAATSTAQAQSKPVLILMTSSTGEVTPGEDFRVEVNVDSQGRGISGVQVSIDYDPASLRVAGVEPGTLLGPEPAVAGPIIDETDGVVEYAVARIGPTEPPTPPGLFATVRFQVLDTAGRGRDTVLDITAVKVPDENVREIPNVLTGESLTVKISP